MRILIAIAALAALPGCISLGGEPPPYLLTLQPDQQVEAGVSRSAGAGTAITINRPEAPQKLAVDRVVVQTSPTTLAYLQNATWADVPAELFRALLSEVVAARTGRVVLDPAQYTSDPGTIVTGRLLDFGYEVAGGEAVVVYEAAITDGSGVRTRRFEAREPAIAEVPRNVGQALNRAANRVAVDVADWLAGG